MKKSLAFTSSLLINNSNSTKPPSFTPENFIDITIYSFLSWFNLVYSRIISPKSFVIIMVGIETVSVGSSTLYSSSNIFESDAINMTLPPFFWTLKALWA